MGKVGNRPSALQARGWVSLLAKNRCDSGKMEGL